MSDQMKTCTKCGVEKAITEFHRNARSPGGHRPDCKVCHNECSRKYREANSEKTRESNRKWKADNPEKARESVRKWNAANPEKMREYSRTITQRRLDRMKALSNTLTDLQFLVILTYYRFGCAYCGAPWQEEDHVIPVVQDGGRTKENIVPACKPCNLRKGPRTPEQAGMSLRARAMSTR